MKRRQFSRLLAGISLWPMATHAQTDPAKSRVGYLHVGPKQLVAPRIDAIMNGLRASGYASSRVEMVVRMTEGDPSKITPMVADIIGSKVSVFVAGGPATLRAAQETTSTVPIVAYDFETDPVAQKYAQSIAHPSGNVTGVFLDLPDFSGKWIELLRECVPRLSRVALIWDPSTGRMQVDFVNKIAAGLNIQTDLLEVKARADFAAAFAVSRERGAGAAILMSSPLAFTNSEEVAGLAQRHRLPAISMFSEFARAGGLLSYGPNLFGVMTQAAFMAGKVLAGSTPADMPLERPSTFELIVNQRAAEALGLAIPASIQARASEVIE